MGFEIGATVGDYQVVEVLGSGGMGQVYKVRNLISDRMEAMKVLLPNLDSDQELAERFIREIKVQASLDHPNIGRLHTAQRIGNQLVMIMEFLEGYTIEALMRRGRIPLAHSIDFASQVLEALAYAHSRGVVHRDIKPANMMLTPQGVVKLMDFGIAKINDRRLTQTGKTVGSLFYMSPEQIRGEAQIDARADLYSLGVVLYEMATGRRPFEGESDYSIMAAHLQQLPLPPLQIDPSLPEILSDIILMALAKDPAKRFQTADAFRAALGSAASQLGSAPAVAAAPPMQPGYAAPPPAPNTATLPKQAGYQSQPQMFSHPAPQPSPTHPMQAPAPRTTFEPPPQPQFRPMPPPPPAQRSSHRGLYMVVGSLVTIGVLGAGIYFVPKWLKTGASSKPATQVAQVTPTPQQVSSPTPQPVSTPLPAQAPPIGTPPPQTPTKTDGQVLPQDPSKAPPLVTPPVLKPPVVSVTPPVKSPTPAPPTKPVGKTPDPAPQKPVPPQPLPVVTPQPQPGKSLPPPTPDPYAPRPPVNPPVPPPSAMPQPNRPVDRPAAGNRELEELVHQRDLMRPRIHAVNESMRALREQNAQNGLGVSGELVASHKRMGFFMEVANDALRGGNVAEARTALLNAERELDKLERRFNH